MKALLLYSHASGHRNFTKSLAYVKKELGPVFNELKVVCTFSKEEASRLENDACGVFDVLLIVGGDGTFNNAVNQVMQHETKPILGYLNFGTIGDVGKNYGIHGSLKRAVSIIKDGHYENYDVGQIGESYFAYMCAVGAYSDISYATKRKKKRFAGRFAYYFMAIREAFQRQSISYRVEADGKQYMGETPFLLLLNGKYIAGFPINSSGDVQDGKMELFLVKKGLFNGLLNYLFHRKVQRIVATSFKIEVNSETPWCLDGEKGLNGNAVVETHPRAIRVFSKGKKA
jgi:diacylglycerol kinase (ATP)